MATDYLMKMNTRILETVIFLKVIIDYNSLIYINLRRHIVKIRVQDSRSRFPSFYYFSIQQL